MNQVGYAICHQLPERSLTYGGRALPVCARDTGLFIGFTVGTLALLLAYGALPRRYPDWPKLAILFLFIVPTVADALSSYAGLRESTNALRLATGSLAGAGLAALVFPLAVTQLSMHLRSEPDLCMSEASGDATHQGTPRVFESWWSLALLILIPAAVSLLLRPRWTGAYWLWAPLVTLSIIFTFLVLNFTLVSLVWTWVRSESRIPSPALSTGVALVAGIAEVILSNRLHWVVQGKV